MILLNKNIFKYSLTAIISIEILSFLSFQYPTIAPYIFGIVALAVLIATIKNLEWGIYIVFAELIIGSFGKILVLPILDFQLPIRMVIWGIVMAIWLVHAIKTRRVEFFHSQFFKPYLILAAVLGWGIVWGIWRGNDLGVVFFDVNNYLYFLLVFPVYEVLSSRRDAINRVSTIIASAIAWLSVKTILLFYIFSHELFGLQDVLYAWSRRMQLAEITNISPVFLASRIFMQSQVWILFGLFVGLGYVLYCHSGAKRSGAIESSTEPYRPAKMRGSRATLILSILFSAALIMSFSRSFWLAMVVSLAILAATLLFVMREQFTRVLRLGGISLGVIVLAVGFTLGVISFPIPRGGESGAGLLKDRIEKFSTEPAANSRIAQIRPLLTAIAEHPALGSGFGTAVTYQSQDPRVLKNHPDGWYTTTAFELGWLEMWLKIGLVGVGAYLYLLWKIFKTGFKRLLSPCHLPAEVEGGGDTEGVLCYDRYLILGGLVGLVAVAITHGLSPYLNHPLGIGVVMLMAVMVDKDN